MKIFYFTSTGNSLSVAKKFKNAELISIPQALKNNELSYSDEEKIGIIYPTHGMSMPTNVKQFISSVTLNAPYIFVITTCGGSPGGALDNFVKIAKSRNIKVNFSYAIIMPENYLNMFDMANNAYPDDTKLNKLIEAVNNNTERTKGGGFIHRKFTTVANSAFTSMKKSTGKHFTVESNCTLCQTCAKVCPNKNVIVNESVSFGDNCLSCFACTQNCPENAIRFKKEKSKARYRHREVSLVEIIEANNQF